MSRPLNESGATELYPPVTFEAIAEEIVRHLDLPREEVTDRLWKEALESGWSVRQQVQAFGVRPHHFDAQLERLYREGDAFIFETLVFWSWPPRQRWIQHAVERLRAHAATAGRAPEDMRVLILGDGTGNDSLVLAAQGFNIDYFDFPGSKTFEFATRRFRHRGLLDQRIFLRTELSQCLPGAYDAVLSFEVLEHLEDPMAAVRDIAGWLKPAGIALITEAFGSLGSNMPTHLASNGRFDGRVAFMFARHGMRLSWYSRDPLFKPYEFQKVERVGLSDRWRLATDRALLRNLLLAQYRALKRRLRPHP